MQKSSLVGLVLWLLYNHSVKLVTASPLFSSQHVLETQDRVLVYVDEATASQYVVLLFLYLTTTSLLALLGHWLKIGRSLVCFEKDDVF